MLGVIAYFKFLGAGDLTRQRRMLLGQHSEQGRFAAAVETEQTDARVSADAEIDPFDQRFRKTNAELFYLH